MADAVTDSASWRRIEPWPRTGQGERHFVLEAEAAERDRVAALLGLESVERLTVDVILRPWLDGMEVVGQLDAIVGRICGVTLDPYQETVCEPLRLRFLPPGSRNLPDEAAAEVVVEMEAEDPPEPGLVDGVDLAAMAVESLSLGLAPFARKPGVTFTAPDPPAEPSPFAALASLVNRRPDAS